MIQIVILTLMIMIAIVANTRVFCHLACLGPNLGPLPLLCLNQFVLLFFLKAGRSSQMEQNIFSRRFLAQCLLHMQEHALGSWSVLLWPPLSERHLAFFACLQFCL